MCGSPRHPPRYRWDASPFQSETRFPTKGRDRKEKGRGRPDRPRCRAKGPEREPMPTRIAADRRGRNRDCAEDGGDPRRGMASRDRSGSLGGYPSRRGGCKIPTERDRSTGSILVGSCTPRAHPFLLRRFLSGYIPSRNEQGGPSDLPTRIDSPRFHPSGCIGRI